MQNLRKVAVIGGVRTPFCRGNTGYDDLTNLDLMTAALNGLVAKYGLEGQHIDEVVGGAVVTHARDFNLTREAVIGTKLKEDTPGVTLSQACGTSLQAALGSAAKIATGQIEVAIACGSDTVSDPPIELKRQFAKRLAAVSAEKTVTKKAGAFFSGFSLGDLAVNPPAVSEPRTGLSMGQHCELMAKEWHIAREAQDQLAFESHRKAAAAYDAGFLDDLLVPASGVFRDNNLRADIALEKIAQLKPAFDREAGTLTAANSTPLTDGASAVLLASEEWAAAHGLKPLAYLTYGQHYAVDFVDAGQGLLMAPTIAVSKMLDRAGLTLAGLRLLRDPRGVRRAGAVHAQGLGRPAILQDHAGQGRPARRHRPRQAERQGLKPRLWPSLRGDRRAHRGDARENPRRERRRARADFDLHGRRHGRLRDPGAAPRGKRASGSGGAGGCCGPAPAPEPEHTEPPAENFNA